MLSVVSNILLFFCPSWLLPFRHLQRHLAWDSCKPSYVHVCSPHPTAPPLRSEEPVCVWKHDPMVRPVQGRKAVLKGKRFSVRHSVVNFCQGTMWTKSTCDQLSLQFLWLLQSVAENGSMGVGEGARWKMAASLMRRRHGIKCHSLCWPKLDKKYVGQTLTVCVDQNSCGNNRHVWDTAHGESVNFSVQRGL